MVIMEKIVHAVVNVLSREVGGDLENIYLYGSLAQQTYQVNESDINLLLVASESLDIHHLRTLFRPLWQEYGRRLVHAPLVATRRSLLRHLLLNPAFAHHLAAESKPLLGGDNLFNALPGNLAQTPEDNYAFLAHETLHASAALVPKLWPAPVRPANMRKLRGLARRLFKSPVSTQETAVTLFARIQEHLTPLIASLPQSFAWKSGRTATSPLVPGLQATYTQDQEKLLMIFSQFSSLQLSSIGWNKLASRLAKEYKGLYLTTSVQLRLINQFETPLDVFFRRSKHTWGEDPLQELPTKSYYKLRQVGRRPSGILVDALPHAYLTSPDEDLNRIIHDFQNKLLNVQLESELMARMGLAMRGKPPLPLPGREALARERINAIFNHLDWWADYFSQAMQQAAD